tara:strand:- start:25 stop:252 length:228 start_codon:yes stop_codon:yes gene_type:complete
MDQDKLITTIDATLKHLGGVAKKHPDIKEATFEFGVTHSGDTVHTNDPAATAKVRFTLSVPQARGRKPKQQNGKS